MPKVDTMLASTSQRGPDCLRLFCNMKRLLAKSGKLFTIGEKFILQPLKRFYKIDLSKRTSDTIKRIPLNKNTV